MAAAPRESKPARPLDRGRTRGMIAPPGRSRPSLAGWTPHARSAQRHEGVPLPRAEARSRWGSRWTRSTGWRSCATWSGPRPAPRAARRGFDVNAAAARLRDSLLPAGLRNRPPPEPEPEPAALESGSRRAGARARARRGGRSASRGRTLRSRRWDRRARRQRTRTSTPASLGGDGGEAAPGQVAYDPGAAGVGPNAQPYWIRTRRPTIPTPPRRGTRTRCPTIPTRRATRTPPRPERRTRAPPDDPNAVAAWDPNAAPYDPNAPAEPYAAEAGAADPGAAGYDPNAAPAWDPNAAPYNLNARALRSERARQNRTPPRPERFGPGRRRIRSRTPPRPWDPNAVAAWDPNAPADPYAAEAGAADPGAAGYDPNAAAAWDPNAVAYAAPAEGDALAFDPALQPLDLDGTEAPLDPNAGAPAQSWGTGAGWEAGAAAGEPGLGFDALAGALDAGHEIRRRSRRPRWTGRGSRRSRSAPTTTRTPRRSPPRLRSPTSGSRPSSRSTQPPSPWSRRATSRSQCPTVRPRSAPTTTSPRSSAPRRRRPATCPRTGPGSTPRAPSERRPLCGSPTRRSRRASASSRGAPSPGPARRATPAPSLSSSARPRSSPT